jgi:hypothetical protein
MLPRSALLPAALAVAGCSSLDQYTTAPGESYCGSVTATASFRAGVPAGMEMRLTLDATALDGESSPGTVWASTSPGSAAGRFLDAAPLQRIPALENDALSTPDLGGGRDTTRLFGLTPSEAAESAVLGVVSLRSDDGVEVRLLRPGLGTSPPPGQGPIFGLFVLYKQAGTCGF